MGKGSKMRPMDKKRFDDNFDRIFKKEKQCLAVEEKESAKEDKE